MHKKATQHLLSRRQPKVNEVNLTYHSFGAVLRSKNGFKVNKKFFPSANIANVRSIRFSNHFYPFSLKRGKSIFFESDGAENLPLDKQPKMWYYIIYMNG